MCSKHKPRIGNRRNDRSEGGTSLPVRKQRASMSESDSSGPARAIDYHDTSQYATSSHSQTSKETQGAYAVREVGYYTEGNGSGSDGLPYMVLEAHHQMAS